MILSNEPWWTCPSTGFYSPQQDGTTLLTTTLGAINKPRLHEFAGMPNMLVESGNWRGGNLNWGTRTSDSPSNTAVTGTPQNIESGSGATAHVKYTTNADGSQSYAQGRITKYADGRLVMNQYADDQLYSLHPRCQFFGHFLLNLSGYWRQYVSVTFGDSEVPWPSYANNVNKDRILFYQLKAPSRQPVLQLTAGNNATDTSKLDIEFNVKPTNAGAVTNVHTVTAVDPTVRHDFVIDTFLDWRGRGASGGKAYNALWYSRHGETPQLVYVNTTNTLMSDIADVVQPMWGIYRFEWDTKATDACRIIFHRAGIKNASRPLSASAFQTRGART